MVIAPAETPVTSPKASTLPIAGLLLLHAPPVVASDKVIAWNWHTLFGPVIGAGNELTVILFVAIQAGPIV